MGWEDRPYYREGRSGPPNPLMWLVSGSVPLFTAFGIRVRAHASLVILIVMVLLFGLGQGYTWQDRVQSMSILFTIVLLHEFGHCLTARWVGGEANDILMHPLGGLAFTQPPHRPLPQFLTSAGGPAVNVLICIVCGSFLWWTSGWLPWNPFRIRPLESFNSWIDIWRYAYWIYLISWSLLLFNLLPIFPLDGGQMLQAALWPKFGYYKSMLFACVTGMIGAVICGAVALASFRLNLAILALCGFMYCRGLRYQVLANGPYAYEDETNYNASIYGSDKPRRKKLNSRTIKKAQKLEQLERIEQRKIDAILAKVSAKGMHSLTWWEKRTLRKATERQRQSETAGTRR